MDEETETSPDLSSVAPSAVVCDVCTGRKRKAEQSCLQCLASYCDDHLDTHNILYANAKRHKMVVATGRLEDCVCPEHDKLMEVFCRTDQQCICHLCITSKHRAHDVVSIEYEVADVKSKLGATKKEITGRIEIRQREMQELQQAIDSFMASSKQAVEENDKSFTELIDYIEKRQREAKEMISARKEDAVRTAEELLERLPSEIKDLKKREFELQHLEHLSELENGVHFLKGILSTPPLSSSSSSSPVLFVHPYISFTLATEAVSDLIREIKDLCTLHFTNISKHVKMADILKSPVLKLREVFLQNASKLTLNPDTAHTSIRLSKENGQLTTMHEAQDYPEHRARFDSRAQILCNEHLQGAPKYWEVEIGGPNWVCLAVSYIGITRKGKRGCLFGRNPCSWCLRCYPFSYEFWHNDKSISVKYDKRCSRIGVYLDHGLGILEFYNVSDDMSLIYKAQTKFTEPVYAGFGLAGKGTHIKLCDLEEDKVMC
ncbi:tripartite motif-containing protein 16 [Clarias gariepinus]